jgi:hypothetical protein
MEQLVECWSSLKHSGNLRFTNFDVEKPSILSKLHIFCIFMILTIDSLFVCRTLTGYSMQLRQSVFTVRWELNFYILFSRTLIFKAM